MKILDTAFRYLALLGAVSFAAAACITVVDVVMRKFSGGILGTVDYVQLFIVSGAFLAMPYAFRVNAHVSLDLVSNFLPPFAQWLLGLATSLLTLGFCCLLGYYSTQSALSMLSSSDISMNIGIPMWIYWAPFALGLVGSSVAMAFNVADQLRAGWNEPGKSAT
ncbi:TRAP transporter small permease [Hoeflea ulvae]|uniref:TRAP transporter small permease protein n=1 Tax=Hoeflea ulvae TaxID=2983764 RepID=A0ABT3YLE6_9HYPH|nr:TRAP transporter small permease [Hoeflea ulvae]MCY0096746.1 TRAP transporter small permease subunit [Hoeflea ulvae]